jgi:hypothetical protein
LYNHRALFSASASPIESNQGKGFKAKALQNSNAKGRRRMIHIIKAVQGAKKPNYWPGVKKKDQLQ